MLTTTVYPSVKSWARDGVMALWSVWSIDGKQIGRAAWNSRADYDLGAATFQSVFGHAMNAEAGDLVGHRAISITDGEGLEAVRRLLGNPGYMPTEIDWAYLKRLSVDGTRPLYDSHFADVVRGIIAEKISGGPSPTLPPAPTPAQVPPVPVPAPTTGPGLSSPEQRVDELWAWVGQQWPVVRPIAIQALKMFRKAMGH